MKDDSFEGVDVGPGFPGVLWQSGFLTGPLEKGLSRPSIFYGDLRKQKTSPVSLCDEEPVFSHFDFSGIFDLFKRSEDRDLEVDILQLGGGDRRKTGVLGGGIDRGLDKSLVQRQNRLDEPNAPSKLSVFLQRDKGAFLTQELGIVCFRLKDLIVADISFERFPGDL